MTNDLTKDAVLLVLCIPLEGTDKYVQKEQCKVSQAMPSPEHNLRCVPEKQFHSGRETENSIKYYSPDYTAFQLAELMLVSQEHDKTMTLGVLLY